MARKSPSKPSPGTRFLAKVNLVQAWNETRSPPDDIPVFSTMTAFRRWEDPRYGVLAWASFSVDAPGGENASLRSTLDRILAEFVPLQKKLRGLETRSSADRLTSRRLKAELRALTQQNELLATEVFETTEELKRAVSLVAVLQAKVRERDAEIANLKRQKSVLVRIT